MAASMLSRFSLLSTSGYSFSNLINNNGKVDSVEEVGKKKLAYEINKQREGHYVLYTFDAEPNSIVELERNYRITDEVIKFIVVRKDEE